jgi:4-hydroxybenzoate polyprenyltransferase
MNVVGLRFVISLVSIATALIAFMAIGNPWAATGVIVGIFILSAIIGRMIWERFADAETKRRDLEDRVRNPPL